MNCPGSDAHRPRSAYPACVLPESPCPGLPEVVSREAATGRPLDLHHFAHEQAVADADTFFAVEFPALGEWGFSAEDAKRIDMPVLLVSGEQSIPWFVESDALLGEWLPHSERSAIAGASHFLQMVDPAPVAESLATFFGRHPMS
jgi:pimeloyl-ACP methyl ester carboxylesterase